MWINLKTSRLGQASFLLAYLLLAGLLLKFPSVYIKLFIVPLIAQAAWAWRVTWGNLSPICLYLKEGNPLRVKLKNQQEEYWQPPALVFNRWLLVFQRPSRFAKISLSWPYLITPFNLTRRQHQEFRRFLRSWR